MPERRHGLHRGEADLGDVGADAADAAVSAAARASYGKLIAFLAARTRDLAAAEDALSAAFEAALRDWPVHGVPASPEAWLLTAARRRAIDAVRRRRTQDAAVPELLLLADVSTDDAPAPDVPDERLRLLFACAHPAVDPGVRAPLMLQTVLGLDAASIASAFLVAPSAMSQRLVRAKAKIKRAGIPFRVPEPDELPERLDSVLDAVYACFSEGWADPAGLEARRRNLAEEGLWLGRLLAALMPDAPEALGLLALMLHAQARREARRGPDGRYIPLAGQDPARWDRALIAQAEALLRRASGHIGRPGAIGRYQLEAAIQSAHVAPRLRGRPADWPAVARLYDALFTLTGSPVVALNRAVAIAQTEGAAAGLAALEAIDAEAGLTAHQPYWAARADLLSRAGRAAEADAAYLRAIGLEADPAVRRFLQDRRGA